MKKLLENIAMGFAIFMVLLWCTCMVASGIHEDKRYEQCKSKGGKYVDNVCLKTEDLIPLD